MSVKVILSRQPTASDLMGATMTQRAAPQPEKVKSIRRLHLPLTASSTTSPTTWICLYGAVRLISAARGRPFPPRGGVSGRPADTSSDCQSRCLPTWRGRPDALPPTAPSSFPHSFHPPQVHFSTARKKLKFCHWWGKLCFCVFSNHLYDWQGEGEKKENIK